MMKWPKQCFAPTLASFGATAYLKGDYRKATLRILKSIEWLPQMNDSEVFMGVLGVSLSRLGKEIDAAPYLTIAREKLAKHTNADNSEFKNRLIREIENELRKNT